MQGQTRIPKLRKNHTVSLHRVLVLLLLAAPTLGTQNESSESVPPESSSYARLLAAVQGPQLMVSASPALCAALGRPQPPGAKSNLNRWLFGSGACTLFYPPDLHGVVTRATTGLEQELSSAPAAKARLITAINNVLIDVETQPPEGISRLLYQSLAWEIGLAAFRAEHNNSDPNSLACRSLDMVERLSLGAKERESLPSTLESLGDVTGIAEVAARIEQLKNQDPLLLEVTPPSNSHAEALRGRFHARIFLTSEDPKEAARLAEHLKADSLNYDLLGQLPFRYDGLSALLLLYFNGLEFTAEGPQPVPTPVLAFWQEYTFAGRVDTSEPLAQAEEKLTFRSVAAKPALDASSIDYREVEQESMAHKSFVDAMPPTLGSPVTTKRGVCLKCHTRVVEAFHPESKRDLEFLPAMTPTPEHLLSQSFTGDLPAELARWQKACRP